MKKVVIKQKLKRAILSVPRLKRLVIFLYKTYRSFQYKKMLLDWKIWLRPSFLISKLKKKIKRRKYNYDENNARRLFVYCIYESEASLRKYKLYFLKALRMLTTDLYIVVNGELPKHDLAELAKYGVVQQRENAGYDIGAFKWAIEKLGKARLSQFDQLVLVNDTLIGPFFDFKQVFSYFNVHKKDFWGLSAGEKNLDSLHLNPYGYIPSHIQSYFIVFEKTMLASNELYDYFANLPKINNRNEAVLLHETVMTKHFFDFGYSYGTFIKYNYDSPMYLHPLKMVRDFKMPVIKKNSLTYADGDKCQKLNFLTEVPELLKYLKKLDYPYELIEEVVADNKRKEDRGYILIIDGSGNDSDQINPQVLSKKRQLELLGYQVKVINESELDFIDALYNAKLVIIDQPKTDNFLEKVLEYCQTVKIKVLFDLQSVNKIPINR